jgi:long-chain fatty acid transport protein
MSRTFTKAAFVAGALVAASTARTASADPLDTFGFGARASSMAGATTAATRGSAATHANPAAVASIDDPEVTIGWAFDHMALSLAGKDANVLDAHGTDVGLAIPIEFGGMTHAFGLALYLPDQFIARLQLIPATEPHFVRFDNDVHRIVAEPVYSVRLSRYLSLGAGVSILTDVAGNGITFDVGVVGGEKVGESALDVSLPTSATPLVGILVTPTPRVRIGGAWRGELDLGLKLDILANVDVAGVVTGDALISLRAVNYFTPNRVNAGIAVDVTDELTLTAEIGWQEWSRFKGGVPDLKVLVALGISPPLVPALFPEDHFEDVWTPRVGAEWSTRIGRADFAIRMGYAYEPSPVPEQTGLTSFADNDRHIVGFGLGLTLRAFQPILTRPVSFDLGTQWQHLTSRLTIKDQMLYPGVTLRSAGEILRGGMTMTVSF